MPVNPFDDAVAQLPPLHTTPQQNPYDAVVADVRSERELSMRVNVKAAQDTTPDQSAEAARLSQTLGVPLDVATRNLDDARKKAAVEAVPYAQILDESPKLAAWLGQSPAHVSVVHDDLEQLGFLDWVVTAPSKAFAQAVDQQRYAELRYQSMFRPLTREEQDRMATFQFGSTKGGNLGATTWFRKAVTGTGQFLANQIPVLKYGAAGVAEGAAIGGAVGSVVPGVGTLAGAAAVAPVTGGAGLIYGVLKSTFQQESANAYDEYLNFRDELGQPLDPGVAKLAALAVGAINAPIEAGAQEFLLRSIPGINRLSGAAVRGAVKEALLKPTVRAALAQAAGSYLKTLTAETAQEVAQRGVTILAGELAKSASGQDIAHRGAGDIASDLAAEGAGAATSFALGVLPGPTVHFVNALGEAAAQSKTLQRSPEAVQALVEQATEGTSTSHVYAPIDTWATYWQSKGEDPEAKATELTGDATAYQIAVRTGEDLVIPTGRYTVQLAPTEHNAFFANELRLAPEEMNGRELQQVVDAQQGQQEPATGDNAEPTDLEQIHQQLVDQLVTGGKFDPDQADAYATLVERGVGRMAQDAGLNPLDVYQRYGLQVQRPGLTEAAPQAQTTEAHGTRPASEGTDRSGSPSLDRVAESRPVAAENEPGRVRKRRGESDEQLAERRSASVDAATTQRKQAHYTDLFRYVATKAQSLDAGVDLTALRQQFDDRIAMRDDALAYERESGHAPLDLLRAIAANGGIGSEAFGGRSGERRMLMEDATAGRYKGIQVFKNGGLSFDDMVTALRQDQRFNWINTPDELHEAIDNALRHRVEDETNVFPGSDTLRQDLGIDTGRAWWTPADAERAAIAADEGDASFNTSEFGQSLFKDVQEGPAQADLLDTGEVQPRLPGAEAVRETENATPQLDAPFALTSEVSKAKKGKQTTLFQPAYHGSPHIFDQFSLHKIGSGEGAQAYGWGLYFAGSKEVAQFYREGLANEDYFVDGERVATPNTSSPLGAAVWAVATQGEERSLKRIAEMVEEGADPQWLAQFRAAVEALHGHTVERKTGGRLYQVEIPENDDYLDWDKPLSEQSEKVKKAVGVILRDFAAEEALVGKARQQGVPVHTLPEYTALVKQMDDARTFRDTTGGMFYQRLVSAYRELDHPRPEQAASEDLAKQGFAGIKYLDQLSRGGPSQYSGDPAYLHAAQSFRNDGQSAGDALAGLKKAYKDADHDELGAAVDEAYGTPPKETFNYVIFDDRLIQVTGYEQRKNGDRRGSIQISPNRKMTVNLFERADLSTFLHETGHFFLEVFTDLANDVAKIPVDQRSESQQRLLGNHAALSEYLVDEDHTGPGFSTKQHEHFAAAFEAYLFEGKAPSDELRSVFQRFRSWLLGVYRSLQNIGATLTPEVRGVFDRMLASDEEIAAADAEGRIGPLFTTPELAGMTPVQFDAYRETVAQASARARDALQSRLLKDFRREQAAQFGAARDAIRATVASEIQQQPVYQALAAIRKGTKADGPALVEGQEPVPMKLSKSALAPYDAATLAALRRYQLYTVDESNAVHPDAIATMFGFESGDALVQALATAAPMTLAIDAETGRRMAAAHPDLLSSPEQLATQAQQAVYGEGRQTVIVAELKALTKGMTARVIPSAKRINALAEERIAAVALRSLRPGLYLMAARRASQRAFDLLSAHEDRAGAVQAKQQELINLALYREATTAKDEADAGQRYLRDHDTTAARARLGKAGADWLDQWDGALSRYELKRVPQYILDRRASMAKWIAAQEAQGLPVDLPPELVEDSRRVNWQSLTVEQFRGVVDGMKSLRHLANLKNRLLQKQAGRTLAEERTHLATSIRDNYTGPPRKTLGVRLPKEQAARSMAKWFAAPRKLAFILNQLDGFTDGGPLWEAIQRPINASGDAQAARNADASETEAKLWDAAFGGRERSLYRSAVVPGTNISLSHVERIAVALNWGNEGNRDRLVSDRFARLSAEDIQKTLQSLTAQDLAFVQGVWDWFDTYRPEMAAKQRRVTGLEPEWVTPVPFTVQTADGQTVEMRGGYYPIAAESWLSARAASHVDANFGESLKRASYVASTTARGHLEARVEHNDEPLRLDLGVISEHVAQVIHDLTHHEMLIDVTRLLGSREVQDSIFAQPHGDVLYEQMKGAIRDIAWGESQAPDWFRPLNYLRQGVVIGGLAWNVGTVAQQPFQAINGMVEIGPKWIARGFIRWMRNAGTAEHTAAWIAERSMFMRNRSRTFLRENNELRNRVGLNHGRVEGWMRDGLATLGVDPAHMPVIADSYFYLISKGQQLADIPVWLGAYEKFMADPANDEDRAVALADQAVINSQGSGQIKDLSTVERNATLKLLTTFFSYQNIVYNQAAKSIGRTDFRSPRAVGRLGVDALLLLLIPSAITYALHAAIGGNPDDTKHSLWVKLAKHEIADLLGLMVGIRELSGPVEGYDYEGPAGTRYIATLARLANQISQGEADAAFWKSLNQSAGIVFHYPATQVQRSADGLHALLEGKSHNPTVLLTGPRK